MSDIELRFIERQVPAPEFGKDITKAVRILQYRKQYDHVTTSGVIGLHGTSVSGWIDVPLVVDESK